MDKDREEICQKLRVAVSEFGQERVAPAIIIGPEDLVSPVSGHQYVRAATLGTATLANVDWKVARCFEDATV